MTWKHVITHDMTALWQYWANRREELLVDLAVAWKEKCGCDPPVGYLCPRCRNISEMLQEWEPDTPTKEDTK